MAGKSAHRDGEEGVRFAGARRAIEQEAFSAGLAILAEAFAALDEPEDVAFEEAERGFGKDDILAGDGTKFMDFDPLGFAGVGGGLFKGEDLAAIAAGIANGGGQFVKELLDDLGALGADRADLDVQGRVVEHAFAAREEHDEGDIAEARQPETVLQAADGRIFADVDLFIERRGGDDGVAVGRNGGERDALAEVLE